MSRADDLRELLARVKSATGANFALEEAIEKWRRRDDPEFCAYWAGRVGSERWRFPPYTASLDAALGLATALLPGWSARVSFGAVNTACLWPNERADQIQSQDGATPALALIAALLSALIAQESENGR